MGAAVVVALSCATAYAGESCAEIKAKATTDKGPGGARSFALLVKAVDSGNLTEVRKLLKNGASVNGRNAGDDEAPTDRPLARAAAKGNLAMVQLLLGAGASVDACCCSCVTALHSAIDHKHAEVVECLLDAGASPLLYYDGDTPTMDLARKSGDAKVIRLLEQWRVMRVLTVVESRLEDPFSLAGLAEVEADLISTVTASGVIGNGGFVYWFEGKDAKATMQTATAFDRLGLPAVADAMRASLKAFPGNKPPEELAARQTYVSAHREALAKHFRKLDGVVWDADYNAAAFRFIQKNRAALVGISKDYAALLKDLR